MPFNAKAMGNALAKRMRGFEDTGNQTENPENTPAPNTFDVPVAAIGDSMEGDEITVRVVSVSGDMATLEKVESEAAGPPVPTAEELPPLG
jgi:hypothetical protein